MLENDAKNSFGAFSHAGKNSAEVFDNVKKKDLILNLYNKKTKNKQSIISFLKRNKYHNIDGEEENKKNKKNLIDDSQSEEIEDEETDIFSKSYKDTKLQKKSKNKKKCNLSYYHRLKKEDYKFHDLHMSKKKEKVERLPPTCTKYVPNTNFIWKRTITGPKWETMGKRKSLFKHEEHTENTGYYLYHENALNHVGRCFINMKKQTMRGDVFSANNLRVPSTKAFSPNITSNNISKNIKYFSPEKKINNLNKANYYNRKISKLNRTPTVRTTSIRSNISFNDKKTPNKKLTNLKYVMLYNNANTTNENLHNKSKSFSDSLIKNSKNDDENSNASSELNDSYRLYKHHYTKQIRHFSTKIKKENSFNHMESIESFSTKKTKIGRAHV